MVYRQGQKTNLDFNPDGKHLSIINMRKNSFVGVISCTNCERYLYFKWDYLIGRTNRVNISRETINYLSVTNPTERTRFCI